MVTSPARWTALPPTPESFEEAFAALQEVVRQLESGALSLEAALELVERGTRLSQTCQTLLEQAELRVTRLPPESASPLSDQPAEP
jgi:exodeoxyribonuclease VII small subunit